MAVVIFHGITAPSISQAKEDPFVAVPTSPGSDTVKNLGELALEELESAAPPAKAVACVENGPTDGGRGAPVGMTFLKQVDIQQEGLLLLGQQLGKPPDSAGGRRRRMSHGSSSAKR